MSGQMLGKIFYSPIANEFAGNGKIQGLHTSQPEGGVYIVDQPAVRQVFLYERATMRLVASTWSEADADFIFENLSTELNFWVIAFDYLGDYRSECSDNLVPELG